MYSFKAIIPALSLAVISLTGCSAVTQNIPVSTNPSGAQVIADGKEMCTSPCSVDLETTQAHILTLKKDGYKQADVQIQQKYDTGGVTRDAVKSGMQNQEMGGSIEGSIAGALISTEMSEENGEAYTLTPSSVVVNLVPEGQEGQSGLVQQKAEVKTTEPATIGDALEKDGGKAAESALEEAAIQAAPEVGTHKSWDSSHSSTHMNKDGSMDTHKSSSSTSVGVKVNPVEAGLDAIHFLEGEENKKDTTEE